jgi:hypothetical protein
MIHHYGKVGDIPGNRRDERELTVLSRRQAVVSRAKGPFQEPTWTGFRCQPATSGDCLGWSSDQWAFRATPGDKRLDCDPEDPVLRVDRLYFDDADEPAELAVSYFDPQHYSYRVKLKRRPT